MPTDGTPYEGKLSRTVWRWGKASNLPSNVEVKVYLYLFFGVKDDFIFKGKLSSMQQQICNSVAVPMARAIGKVVKNAIQQFNIRNGFEKFALV